MSIDRHHTIDYLEFGATDIPKTKAFYSAVFGWKFTDYGPDYVAFEAAQPAGGGGFTTDRKPGTSPLVVLHSRALEATLASVKANGGVIIKEIFSFPGGRRFHFADCNGNELAVWGD
jgi:predicted enzyme related to lactoylglutathione lyase